MSKIMRSSLQYGYSPLMWACLNGHEEIVRILLSAHAQVNVQAEVSSTSLAQQPLVTCI